MKKNPLEKRLLTKKSLPSHVSRIVFSAMVLMIVLSCDEFSNTDVSSEKLDWVSGGFEGPPSDAGPPFDPESWHIVSHNVMDVGEYWGYRVNPRTIFRIPGGIGLMYTSHPGGEQSRDPERRVEQEGRGVVRAGAGSFAVSYDLINWHDYPGNPVINRVQHPWQSPHRAAVRDLLFDPQGNQWVAYFSDAGGDYPGIRAVGAAFSKDMINWEYMDRPMIIINDFASWVPERIAATEEELREGGRVYPHWVVYSGGRFYFSINGSTRTGEGRTYSSIMLVSDSPVGPFKLLDVDEATQPPGSSKPVYWNGKWYSIYTDSWNGQPGFGLAWSDHLTGPYVQNPMNPIIRVESTERTHPYLFNYEGTWAVLFSEAGQASAGVKQPLRLAVSHLHPSLLANRKQRAFPD